MIRRLAVVMTWACLFDAGLIERRVQAQASPSFAAAGTTPAPFTPVGLFSPRWTGSAFVGCENNPSPEPEVFVLAADGTRDNIKLRLGDSVYNTFVFGADVRPDRAVAVIGMSQRSDSRGATFVGFISPDRLQHTYIQLNPYSPRAVTFAADGTIWTAGWVEINGDHASDNFIRRFDPSGKQIGAYLPMGTPGQRLDLNAAGGSFLVACSDRVGWYVPRGPQYLEFNLEGRPTGLYPGVPWNRTQRITGVALRPDGRVFVSREDRTARKAEVFLLDRQTRAWLPVELPGWNAVKQGYVGGFDGDELVAVSLRPGGDYYIERHRVASPAAAKR